jgi:simple sugar transport system permease protein
MTATTTTTETPGTSSGSTTDERILPRSPLRKLLARPELGSVVGAIAVFVFFAFAADGFLRATSLSTVLYASSTIGSWRSRSPC